MSENDALGITQYDLNARLIQNDDLFREELKNMSANITEMKTTLTIHLDAEKKATNYKISAFGLVIGAGSIISVIFF